MHSHKMYLFSYLLCVALIAVGCTKAQQDTTMHDDIAAASQKWMDAMDQGDAAATAALYTQDAQVLPPNHDFVAGRDSIASFFQGIIDMGVTKIDLATVEVHGMGGSAYEVGTFEVYTDSDQMVDNGKYIVIWKNVNGQWKLYRDIWNSSVPISEPMEEMETQ